MGYSRGFVPDYADRCPVCKRKGFGFEQVAKIDLNGYAECPKCRGKVTRAILSDYWRKMEQKQIDIDNGIVEKKWWQFWK